MEHEEQLINELNRLRLENERLRENNLELVRIIIDTLNMFSKPITLMEKRND